jgi:hypothetical protein
MNNQEISKILRHLRLTKNKFIGVFPAEKIPSPVSEDNSSYPYCFVANTDPSWLPGTHWVAVYAERRGSVEYFDSYGRRPMSLKMKRFCGNNYSFNASMLQPYFSASCGQFCIYFLAQRCSGKTLKTIMEHFDPNNLTKNEKLVTSFVHSRFPHFKLSGKCNRFLVSQLCKIFKK